MEDLKSQIRYESKLAATRAREAKTAFAANNLSEGGDLMRQAHDAGRRCQQLIQQYQSLSSITTSA